MKVIVVEIDRSIVYAHAVQDPEAATYQTDHQAVIDYYRRRYGKGPLIKVQVVDVTPVPVPAEARA